MSYSFYKIIHLVGLASLLVSLGMGIAYFLASAGQKKAMRIWVFAMHGVGLALILVSGFGLLARLGLTSGMPNWVLAKLGIWALLALSISLIKRKANWFPATPLLIVLLVGMAASFAILKPF